MANETAGQEWVNNEVLENNDYADSLALPYEGVDDVQEMIVRMVHEKCEESRFADECWYNKISTNELP